MTEINTKVDVYCFANYDIIIPQEKPEYLFRRIWIPRPNERGEIVPTPLIAPFDILLPDDGKYDIPKSYNIHYVLDSEELVTELIKLMTPDAQENRIVPASTQDVLSLGKLPVEKPWKK